MKDKLERPNNAEQSCRSMVQTKLEEKPLSVPVDLIEVWWNYGMNYLDVGWSLPQTCFHRLGPRSSHQWKTLQENPGNLHKHLRYG